MKADVKIFTDMIEATASEQIEHIANLDAFAGAKIRIMPDVHAGKGCVCGFTANLGDKVVPNLIGVDIGCGMNTLNLGKIDIDFEKLDKVIRNQVPSGKCVHGRDLIGDGRDYVRCDCNPKNCVAMFENKKYKYFDQSVGTLGGGNHFVEVDVDDEGNKYLVIHTGSRNFGKLVCEYWQNVAVSKLVEGMPTLREATMKAKRECIENGEELKIQSAIASASNAWHKEYDAKTKEKDLAYLVGVDRDNYIHDMKIAQRWASLNREMIAKTICKAMGWEHALNDMFETRHNYLEDDNIIRKSAISAKEGEIVLIPLNMADGSLICRGKGNEDWNCSAPHGAGRAMSRSQARKVLTMDQYQKSMEGIWTSSISLDTLDEAQAAYKPAEKIIEQIKDTVDIVKRIKPVYNFKAAE